MTGEEEGIPTWREVAELLPPDVVSAILMGPAPTPRQRARRVLADLAAWWGRPRGGAGVIAAAAAGMAATLRVMTGDPAVRVTVGWGETLQQIADRYGVTVAELAFWNDVHPHRIRMGDELKVYPPAR